MRCPFLRLDRAQLPRLNDTPPTPVTGSISARDKQWLGEVDALQQTLRHIDTKRRQLDPAPR
ncbi:hypothetical protein AB0F85_04635 [Nocardia fluminea]|uniref:hypothetical protein n=1 Tax=Nocardia fluminea TaxID=134984 RepID=UPI0033C8F524